MHGPRHLLGFSLLLGIALAGCPSKSSPPGNDAGKAWLTQGDPAQARQAYAPLLAADPQNCDALWGTVLSDVLDGFQSFHRIPAVSCTQGNLPALAPASAFRMRPEGVRSLLRGQDAVVSVVLDILKEWEGDLLEIGSLTPRIEALGCTFHLPSFPLQICTTFGLGLDVTMGTVWGEPEARLLGGLSDLLTAVLGYLLAHDLSVNVLDLIPKAVVLADFRSTTSLLRSLGFIMGDNPGFLTFSPEPADQARFRDVPRRFAATFGEFEGAIPALEAGALRPVLVSPSRSRLTAPDHVVEMVDRNGDGKLDGEDLLHWNVEGRYVLSGTGGTLEGIRVEVPFLVTPADVASADRFLERLRQSFAGTLPVGARISLVEMNGFLAALGRGSFPDVLQMDVQAFFRGSPADGAYPDPPRPIPLRALLPYWGTFPDGTTPFVVEGEVEESESPSTWISAGDAPHFPTQLSGFEGRRVTGLAIPRDCIVPTEPGVMLPYLALQDPTFNGSLFLNLYTRAYCPAEQCPDPSCTKYMAWNPADLYSFNKLFTDFIRLFALVSAPG